MVDHSGVNNIMCDQTATTVCYDCGPQQFFCNDHIEHSVQQRLKSSICHLFARYFHTYILVVYIVIIIIQAICLPADEDSITLAIK